MKNKYDDKLNNLLNEGFVLVPSKYINLGMELFKKNINNFVGFGALYFGITILLSFIPGLSIVVSVISPILMAGFYIVANDTIQNKPSDFNRFFKGFDLFLPLFLANLITGIFVMLGIFLLIIPGLYLAISYSFTAFFIIFLKYDFWEAMEWSRKIITKNFWQFTGLLIILGLINLAGALLCGVGLIVTLPLTSCVMYCVFEDIIGEAVKEPTIETAEISEYETIDE